MDGRKERGWDVQLQWGVLGRPVLTFCRDGLRGLCSVPIALLPWSKAERSQFGVWCFHPILFPDFEIGAPDVYSENPAKKL